VLEETLDGYSIKPLSLESLAMAFQNTFRSASKLAKLLPRSCPYPVTVPGSAQRSYCPLVTIFFERLKLFVSAEPAISEAWRQEEWNHNDQGSGCYACRDCEGDPKQSSQPDLTWKM